MFSAARQRSMLKNIGQLLVSGHSNAILYWVVKLASLKFLTTKPQLQ